AFLMGIILLSKTGLNNEERPEHESLSQPLIHT
ncbi:MAG: hypothetical protein K0Q73_4394, partial [Paenibacillus sp.]|nr:hypothetical protein [Paenibacillus sp.]